MLFKSKKALETHIIVLFIFAIFISMLLTYVVTLLYGNQHPACEELKIKIVEKSRDKGTIRFVMEARGETDYIIREFPELGINKIDENERERQNLKKKGSLITIIPVIVGTDQVYECREKVEKINIKTLI